MTSRHRGWSRECGGLLGELAASWAAGADVGVDVVVRVVASGGAASTVPAGGWLLWRLPGWLWLLFLHLLLPLLWLMAG
jgi:hypothetical protein